jgi:hypothetical protein
VTRLALSAAKSAPTVIVPYATAPGSLSIGAFSMSAARSTAAPIVYAIAETVSVTVTGTTVKR